MAKTRRPNDSYFRKKADDIFMVQFRGQPCEVCGETHKTVGHHVVGKRRSKALRYDKNNIIILCPSHHTMGNELAAHSSNQMAVDRFITWFKQNKPLQHKWCQINERLQRKYSYKQALENLKAGKDAWE